MQLSCVVNLCLYVTSLWNTPFSQCLSLILEEDLRCLHWTSSLEFHEYLCVRKGNTFYYLQHLKFHSPLVFVQEWSYSGSAQRRRYQIYCSEMVWKCLCGVIIHRKLYGNRKSEKPKLMSYRIWGESRHLWLADSLLILLFNLSDGCPTICFWFWVFLCGFVYFYFKKNLVLNILLW